MARSFVRASSQYLESSAPPVTAVPLTMACWFRSDDVTVQQTLMSLANSGGATNYFLLDASGQVGGDPLRAYTGDGAGGVASTSTGYSANTWHHACGVWGATNSRSVYLDGGGKGTNTTTVTPTGINRLAIGRWSASSPSDYMSGLLGEAAIWNVALTDADVLLLARGISPTVVRPDGLIAYYPMWGLHSPEIDLANGNNRLTVTGATAVIHQPAEAFPRRASGQRRPLVVYERTLSRLKRLG